ncbi:MAG: ABC transporter substrate-binding protein [Candidatus Electrothrix aestuarii]|uniref:ABC transporter substrate-binding protein n=1 Tax=Candidatus Electrothrix aestuarii TaxID=3062594 RepID=A0AAU8LXU6_9BACT
MSHCTRCIFWIALLLAPYFLSSCSDGAIEEQKNLHSEERQDDILIGIVAESVNSVFFLQGVEAAVEEINQKGGILGRKIQTVLRYDQGDPDEAKIIAEELADNKDIVAVIGHRKNETAAAAAIIYENAGLLFLSHGAKAPDLTMRKTNYIFRNIPAQDEFGIAMAKRASKEEDINRIVVFHERSDEQKRLADIFKKKAVEEGLKIVATRSYFSGQKNFEDIIAQLKEYQSDDQEGAYDSAVICGNVSDAALLVKQLQEMSQKMFGKTISIIGGDGLDSPELYVVAGKASDGVLIPTVFRADYPDKITQKFVKEFREKNELPPDTWAAQGYDAVHLLAHAMKESSEINSEQIAISLRYLTKWKGVTGSYSFFPQKDHAQEKMPQGDIKGKEIYFKKMMNGHFVFQDHPTDYNEDLFNYLPGRSLRLPLREPITTFDPGFVQSSSDIELCEQLFLGLTGFDPETNEVVPELAEVVPVSNANHTLYTFTIRDEVQWTNGEPVTAYDVFKTIQRNLDPLTGAPHAKDLFVIKNAKLFHEGKLRGENELGVYVYDKNTLVFKLERPTPSFPALVSLPAYRPLPKFAYEQKGDFGITKDIVTNGPYQVTFYEDEGVALKQNEGYYRAADVKIRELRYFHIEQPSMGMALYRNDELDVMGGRYLQIPLEEIAEIKKGPLKEEYHLEKTDAPLFCTYAYVFNSELPPVDNTLVRKAFSAVINRQLLIDAAHGSLGTPATTCIPKTLFKALPLEEREATESLFSPAQAKQWLSEAGYQENKEVPPVKLLIGESVFDRKVAEGVKQFLQHYLEVDLQIEQIDGSRLHYQNQIASGGAEQAHMVMTEVCAAYPDPAAIMNSFAKSFVADFSFSSLTSENKNPVDLIREADASSDPLTREKKYQEADRVLTHEEAVIMPLYHDRPFFLVKPRVKGWKYAPFGGQQLQKYFLKND